MNTRDLEAFIAVVETGSIVAASSKLNLTQPGVTRRVQSLEALLGTALLDRTAKPLRPTITGRSVYDQGRRVIQGVADLRSEVAPDRAVSGELRLGIFSYLPDAAVCDCIDKVRDLYPKVRLHVVAAWAPGLTDQVLRGELDAASICLPDGVAPPDQLIAEELGWQRAFVIAAPALGVPKHATLADLSRFPWVLNNDACGFRTTIRRRLEASHLPFDVAVEAMSRELRMALIARGRGIGLASTLAIETSAWRSHVETIDVRDFQPRVRCWLIARQKLGRLDHPLQLFREAIAASIGAEDSGLANGQGPRDVVSAGDPPQQVATREL